MAESAQEIQLPPAKRSKVSESGTEAIASVPELTEPAGSSEDSLQSQAQSSSRKSKGGGWRKRKQSERDANPGKEQNPGWREYSLSNDLFLNYYKEQSGLIPEADWAAFEAALRRDLPTTFRLTGILADFDNDSNRFWPWQAVVKSRLHSQFQPSFPAPRYGLRPFHWYPREGAWQFDVPPRRLKRDDPSVAAEAEALKPALDAYHEFLVAAAHVGAITRQEAVSMLPVMFLDVQSHHWVLDMCAAPGSKTTQLLEALHTKCDSTLPNGVVVANDVNPQRCHTLITHTKRLNSPALIITQHEAQMFPNPRGAVEQELGGNIGLAGKARSVVYDRILCDVPCSGDGTIRKTPEIWSKWTPHGGLGLHTVQTRILMRAFQLLRPTSQSRIVYSTCSLNPVEDEAVVAQVLLQCKGALELVDIGPQVDKWGLRCAPGLSTWRVMDKKGNWYSSYSDVPEEQRGAIQSTHFPPADSTASLHLERCRRFLPHLEDTGGFFVAVLQVSPSFVAAATPAEAPVASTASKDLDGADVPSATTAPSSKLKWRPGGTAIAPDAPYIKPPAAAFAQLWTHLKDFFGLTDKFPHHQLVTRSEHMAKLFLLSAAALDLFSADSTGLLRVKHIGIRMFERMSLSKPGAVDQEDSDDDGERPIEFDASKPSGRVGPSRCGYRVCQEAAHIFADPAFTDGRRIVHICRADLVTLLSRRDPVFNQMSDSTSTRLQSLEVGSCVFVHPELPGLCLAGWRGFHGCHLLICQADKKAYLQMLGEKNE